MSNMPELHASEQSDDFWQSEQTSSHGYASAARRSSHGRHVTPGRGYRTVMAMRQHRMIITLISVLVIMCLFVGGVMLHTSRTGGTVWGFASAGAAADTANADAAVIAQSDETTSSIDTSSKVAKAVPQPAETGVEAALADLDALNDSARIATSGFTLNTDARSSLEQELSIFDSCGYSVSFVLTDMTTGATLASYAGDDKYSASAIKAPYIFSAAATGEMDLDAAWQGAQGLDGGDATTAQLLENTITVSDNDSYLSLYLTYRDKASVPWAKQYGVSLDGELYTCFSAEDLARMWVGGYDFLFPEGKADSTASTEARQWLGGLFNDTLNSTINMALADRYTVYTKAGWINGEGDLYALNDAGIVASDSGDYVLAVLSDACGEYDLLGDLVTVLDDIHTSNM